MQTKHAYRDHNPETNTYVIVSTDKNVSPALTANLINMCNKINILALANKVLLALVMRNYPTLFCVLHSIATHQKVEVEPLVKELCILLDRVNQSLNRDTFLLLANLF